MHGLGFELLGSEFSWQCQVTLPSQREAGLKGPLGCQRVASAASDYPSGGCWVQACASQRAAQGYSEKRQPGPGLASVASQTPAQGFRQPYAHLTGCPGRS